MIKGSCWMCLLFELPMLKRYKENIFYEEGGNIFILKNC